MRAAPHRGPGPERPSPGALESLLGRVSRGDRGAFVTRHTAVAGSVPGLARRVVKDPPQSEEVARRTHRIRLARFSAGVSACGA
jgi:RNA polymerase sigma-70 factor, ECF subfamily